MEREGGYNLIDISIRILDLLEQKNMSQRELAERIGIQEATISRYINGHRKPHSTILAKMAEVLETTSDYLLGITSIPERTQFSVGRQPNFSHISDVPKLEVADISDPEAALVATLRRSSTDMTDEQYLKLLDYAKLSIKIARTQILDEHRGDGSDSNN
jgi:transcriptional regulator with XRE-family HTH domain